MKETNYKSYLVKNDENDMVELIADLEDKDKILIEVSEIVEDEFISEYETTSIYLNLSQVKELRDACEKIIQNLSK